MVVRTGAATEKEASASQPNGEKDHLLCYFPPLHPRPASLSLSFSQSLILSFFSEGVVNVVDVCVCGCVCVCVCVLALRAKPEEGGHKPVTAAPSLM